jgi:hypothetical protein
LGEGNASEFILFSFNNLSAITEGFISASLTDYNEEPSEMFAVGILNEDRELYESLLRGRNLKQIL